MNFVTHFILENSAWYLGGFVGEALFKKVLPSEQTKGEENSTSQAPTISKKIYLFIPQLFILGTSITIYLAAPKFSLSFFATYHRKNSYLHVIALNTFHGLLVASTSSLGNYIIRQISEEGVEDEKTDKKFTSMLTLTSTSVLVAGSLCRFSYEKILFTQLFIDRTTRHLYASNPSVAAEVTQRVLNTPFGRAALSFKEAKNIIAKQVSAIREKVRNILQTN